MYAMMQTFGPANWFVTISPGMMYNWLAQKIMKRHTGVVTDDGRDCEEFSPGDLDTRSIRVAANPVDCARVFDEMVQNFIKLLLKIGNGPGALGTVKSLLGVVEAQGKGGLHLHAVIMGMIAMVNASRFADDDECMQVYREMVDSLHTGEVDLTN